MREIPFCLDTTYCASPHCKNECGRKASPEIEEAFAQTQYKGVSFGYFCGEDKTIFRK